jgi:hypothetical protein
LIELHFKGASHQSRVGNFIFITLLIASTYIRAHPENHMNKRLLMIAVGTLFAGSVFAQSPAPATTAVKAAPATPAVHAVCKDGTSYDGATRSGACSGHGGIDKKATAATPATAAAKSASIAAKPMSTSPAAMEQRAGGGDGKVWANTSSKVYHCQGDKYYGKTKHGEYMLEADAKTKGFHVSHGKACVK